ncbi:MAG: ABC transporter permease [Leptospiraceae bacterium]|nr:ABC transporter permease [Leptospiraceae bacterium]
MNKFLLKFIYKEMNLFSSSGLRFILAIALGVGTVTGINSYKNNLNSAISGESRNLLGGDMVVESPSPFSDEMRSFVLTNMPKATEGKVSVRFPSMLSNEDHSEIALSTVKAMETGYPFYGEVITRPEDAYTSLKSNEILIEENLCKNFKLKIGDKVQLGNHLFKLSGYIDKEPGNIGSFLSMAPSAIIHLDGLSKTGLEQRGSRIRYTYLLKIGKEVDTKIIKEEKFKELIKEDLTLYDNTEIGSGSQKFINSTYDYMSLLGLSSFFLGAISILISTRARINNKIHEIAVVKCLGAPSSFYFKIFTGEILVFSIIGSTLGLLVGYYFQFSIPDITGSDFLAKVQPALDLKSVIWGLFSGILIPLILSMEAIFKISRLSPLVAIRADLSNEINSVNRLKLIEIIQIGIVYLIFFALSAIETKSYLKGFVLSSVLFVLPIILYLLFRFLRTIAGILIQKEYIKGEFKLVLGKVSRTGSGLSLPIVGIGSALTILLLSLVMRESLLSLSGWSLKEKRANMFVMDIRSEQKSILETIQSEYTLDQKYVAPVIKARLKKLNGEKVKKEETESDSLRRDWKSTARTREYFLSYRDEMYSTEKVIKGEFWKKGDFSQISVEVDFAKALGVKLGDTLSFNVQGVEISGKITNLRSVNWADMKPNFVVLFNSHALKRAPGYFLSSFYLEKPEERYEFQKRLVEKCPNATVIDIEKSIKGLNEIIIKISSIINLITYFVFGSAILLLLSSLYLRKKERAEETALYKIVGASSGFLRRSYSYEAIIISIYSFISALTLSLTANFIFSEYVLEIRYDIPYLEILSIFIISTFVILVLYLYSIQKTIQTPPKEFLRSEL